jgi:hypothetical protein
MESVLIIVGVFLAVLLAMGGLGLGLLLQRKRLSHRCGRELCDHHGQQGTGCLCASSEE